MIIETDFLSNVESNKISPLIFLEKSAIIFAFSNPMCLIPSANINLSKLTSFDLSIENLRLYTDGTAFSWQDKFMLEFDYIRELKKKSVIDASLKEFKLQPNVTDKDIMAWEVFLEQVIQPVQKGTKANVFWAPEGKIIFHYEGSQPSTIENEDFARAFLNIWLGNKTSRPKLRSQLLNKN